MGDLTERDRLFRRVPGPSPWYLTNEIVPIEGFSWEHPDRSNPAAAGKVLLRSTAGVVGVFDFYSYVRTLDKTTLLVWNQKRKNLGRFSSPVELFIIKLEMLTPFSEPIDVMYRQLKDQNHFFVIGGTPSITLPLITTNVNGIIQAEFPEVMRSMDELLILCHSSGIERSNEMADLALMVVEPRASAYKLYPQDWFNGSDMDFGYQWVTRVVRNPKTGRVEGEGVRIAPFELSESMRGARTLFN